MHPAFSIILFTTLSGAGYGLASLLGLGFFDPGALSTKIAHVLALSIIGAGLLASLLHLGNPQRAWRALSQWRSSWLSREGVLAILSFIPLTTQAAISLFLNMHLPLTGIIGAIFCIITVFCTSMIYASLKAIDSWHTVLTPINYLLFAGASGGMLASSFALSGSGDAQSLMCLTLFFTLAAWVAKYFWWRRLDGEAPRSTPESATGLGFIGKVRLFERPHTNDNYLTREMGFRVARKHAAKLRLIALMLGGVLPVLVLGGLLLAQINASIIAVLLALLASLGMLIGILTERWLFFAEARHSVMNYYEG